LIVVLQLNINFGYPHQVIKLWAAKLDINCGQTS